MCVCVSLGLVGLVWFGLVWFGLVWLVGWLVGCLFDWLCVRCVLFLLVLFDGKRRAAGGTSGFVGQYALCINDTQACLCRRQDSAAAELFMSRIDSASWLFKHPGVSMHELCSTGFWSFCLRSRIGLSCLNHGNDILANRNSSLVILARCREEDRRAWPFPG